MRLLVPGLLILSAACGAAELWKARWISVPGAPPFDYGIYHFRRTLELAAKPSSFKVHVTADNRYQLFVNGERVGAGPARGDLTHWRYETYDLAPYLKAGKNLLAAVVWSFGIDAPLAQVTDRTGFLLSGASEAESIANTGADWKCLRNTAYEPIAVGFMTVRGYYAAGPTERLDAAKYPWGWEQPGFEDSAWPRAVAGTQGAPRDASDSPNRWMLVPRTIPMEELKPEAPPRVRSGSVALPFTVPTNTKTTVLLDQDYLVTAYPELTVSGGAGARIALGYAEALFVPGTNRKDNRNEIEGKEFAGYEDVYLADGGAHRTYRPLWWRTWRYLRLNIETAAEPLTIESLRGISTMYPFERKARLTGAPDDLQKILDVGWRTARLCAHETYMDCPYYEQLQYVGDTRIQALVSLYMSGDGRLMRNAIEQIDSSRTAEGATLSRAPSRLQQYIPPFSLWWIGMLHDYWMYQDDPVFVREMLPGMRAVLSFFESYQKPDGSLGRLPWWNFVDWSRLWPGGVPPSGIDGSSAPLDLQLLLAFQWAAELDSAQSAEYRQRADQLRATVRRLYWDSRRRMFADTPLKQNFSQHTNALAVLAGVISGEEARALIERVADDGEILQCTIYFRHYLHSALNAAGAGDRYPGMLGEWRAQLARGLTTWAESPEPSRSDCHAWGASPNFELFRTVLGIDSAAPGFRRVRIRPFLGKLTALSGAVPHPHGEVSVSLARHDGILDAEVALPQGVEGEFIWGAERRPLSPGVNRLRLP